MHSSSHGMFSRFVRGAVASLARIRSPSGFGPTMTELSLEQRIERNREAVRIARDEWAQHLARAVAAEREFYDRMTALEILLDERDFGND